MLIRLIALIVTAFINLILAVSVYKNNPKSATNIIFGTLSLVTNLWLIDVYLSVDPHFFSEAIIWVKLSIFFATPQILLFFLLAHTLPNTELNLSKSKLYLLSGVSLLLMVDALSPISFTGVQLIGSTVRATPGPGLAPFGLFALIMSSSALYILFNKLKHSKGYLKEQYRYVLFGTMILLGLLFFSVLLPEAIFKVSTFVPFVPLYIVVFLGLTTLAIVKHHLFDIRSLVVRSVAYFLTLSSMVAIYGLFVGIVVDRIFPGSHTSGLELLFLVIVTLAAGISFHPIRVFFDRQTSKLFLHDIYDPQLVLDKLSDVLVSSVKVNELKRRTQDILRDTLKPEFVRYVLIIDSDHTKNELFKALMADTPENLTVTEELGIDREKLKEMLHEEGIELAVQLQTNRANLGYLLLGYKKSGELYSNKDQQLISIAADDIAISLQNAIRLQQIQNFNKTLQQKVDDATLEIRRANAKLRKLDDLKDDFINIASHQLRTPLAAISGYVGMVLDQDTGHVPKKQAELLSQAMNSAKQMNVLVTDMLNVSRIESGRFFIDSQPVDVSDLTERVVEELSGIAKGKGINLTYVKPNKVTFLNLDLNKIENVIMNFIDNAIHYSKPNGNIEVKVSENDTDVEFRVVDDGIGVPKDAQKHLFTKFYRAENATKARADGSGIGLYLAKIVIEQQGGQIIFQSEEGMGSQFGFRFPKSLHKSQNLVHNKSHE